jgi:hypothetical protein
MSRDGHVVTSDVSASNDVIMSLKQQCLTMNAPKCLVVTERRYVGRCKSADVSELPAAPSTVMDVSNYVLYTLTVGYTASESRTRAS